MSRKGYIFTNKDNAKKGIMATVLGVISITTLILIIHFSFLRKGVVPERYAAAMLITAIFSLTGIILGVIGFFEKEKFHLFPGIGLALNMIAIGLIGFIIYSGT
ncbi:MAG: DUF6142 family protein [Lachnospiraceae bacterium]|nr:DUF6142 family protein [Lachnospiraceae bacterium]